jgi:uncharacterized membrane protein (UPF0136 family)
MSYGEFDPLSYLIGLTPGGGMLVWGLVLAVVQPSQRALTRWAARYGLHLSDVNRSVISRYLQRTRRLRMAGAGVGWIATGIFVTGVGQFVPLFGIPLMMAIAGYLLGAVIAEATFLRRLGAQTGVRSAALMPRALLDYVPRLSVWALRALPAVLIVLAVLYALMSKHAATPSDPSATAVLAAAALLVVVALAVERLLQAIVARPQPAINAELMAADDAIRASSIHALSGAGVGLVLVGIGAVLFALQYASFDDLVREWLGYPATLAIVLSLVSWIRLGHPRTWRVRRSGQLLSTP